MSVDQISAEQLARLFHEYRRALAPLFECEEIACTAQWETTQASERKLMIATAKRVLSDFGSPCKYPSHERKTAVV